MKKSLKPLACAVALLLSNAASAYSMMQSSISNVTMGVIDLTPDDGVAARFDVSSLFISLDAVLDVGGVYTWASGTSNGSASANYAGNNVGAWQDPDKLSGSSQATGVLQSGDKLSYSASGSFYITVSAHSLFSYGGDYTLWTYGDNVRDNQIHSELEISLGGEYGPRFTYTASGDSDFSKRFWLGYANDTDHDQTLILRLNSTGYTAALASAPLAAVPEPSSSLMFAAGLGLLGWVARRGRRA